MAEKVRVQEFKWVYETEVLVRVFEEYKNRVYCRFSLPEPRCRFVPFSMKTGAMDHHFLGKSKSQPLIRERLSMVAKSKNRVTSIKTTQICWLKTAAWDFLTPARKQLTGNVSCKRTLAERYRNFYFKILSKFSEKNKTMKFWRGSKGKN